MKVWYLAICQNCDPQRPMPFTTGGDRDTWRDTHVRATGHNVETGIEVKQ